MHAKRPEEGPDDAIPRDLRRRKATRRRMAAGALSLSAHVALLLAILTARIDAPVMEEPRAMSIMLAAPIPPAEPAPVEEQREPEPAKAPPRQDIFRETPNPPPEVVARPAGKAKVPRSGVEVSDSQLAGAARAGSGGEGGSCNMPLLLQTALRRDHLARAALAEAHRGRPILVWNGAWVRRPGQEGEGLAAVRESIMWEVGFAPEACRSQVVQGLVLLSMGDNPDAPQIVLGQGQWRWTDLLFSRHPNSPSGA